MGLFSSKKSIVGAVLMVVGTLAYLPGVLSGTSELATYGLVLATALLTIGTYILGTSGDGRPV
ncbi:hypothetical protein SAMN04488063_2082 [Halopelagius inordinatus]|uniref:Uncharacterized protein n=1 Tax=Halopelagius inordinatus TaxID=553467 RepID=A0A1I2S482_9EURY|nr:hypothetical protein [Halopelagius inordinatus]SFG44856.1 hypothetical protein SAMN04488063_2082 [Halopelagius inordinatus]